MGGGVRVSQRSLRPLQGEPCVHGQGLLLQGANEPHAHHCGLCAPFLVRKLCLLHATYMNVYKTCTCLSGIGVVFLACLAVLHSTQLLTYMHTYIHTYRHMIQNHCRWASDGEEQVKVVRVNTSNTHRRIVGLLVRMRILESVFPCVY